MREAKTAVAAKKRGGFPAQKGPGGCVVGRELPECFKPAKPLALSGSFKSLQILHFAFRPTWRDDQQIMPSGLEASEIAGADRLPRFFETESPLNCRLTIADRVAQAAR